MKREWVIVLAIIALFGNGILFMVVALPAWTNYGYFAGDLDRYGEMIYEFILISGCVLASGIFFIISLVEGFK